MKKTLIIFAAMVALATIASCKSKTQEESENDSAVANNMLSEKGNPLESKDDQMRESWMNGDLLDLTKSERDYAAILKMDIDTGTPVNSVEQYYPRSIDEMNLLYDSIDIHCNYDFPYENRYNMIWHVLFMNAYWNRGDCARLYLKTFLYMDPRRLDVDWIAKQSLDVYYYLADTNSKSVIGFYDTLNPKFKWLFIDSYESAKDFEAEHCR